MPKRLRKLLIASVTLNGIFLLACIWVLQEKGGIAYLQLKFGKKEHASALEKSYSSRKRSFFKTLADSMPKGGIVLLGDSLTEVGPWPELLHGNRIRNRGIRGDTTVDLLRRLEDVISIEPKTVALLIGINDLKARVPLDQIEANYAKIIDRLQSDLRQIYLCRYQLLLLVPFYLQNPCL